MSFTTAKPTMATRYLYVMGSGSGAGKSAVCQGLLAWMLAEGYAPNRLAYIKPVTQCTEKQPVALLCKRYGIACVDVGALVFRKGFTRDFVDGKTHGTGQLLAKILGSISRIGAGKAFVVIDGMGDPAAGSVAGVSNADVAAALACPVLFVCKAGIGAAIDNTVLCLSFMQQKGIYQIGLIYNRLPVDSRAAGITKYLSKRLSELFPGLPLFGFLVREERLDSVLKDQDYRALVRWFGGSIDSQALLDWAGLTVPA